MPRDLDLDFEFQDEEVRERPVRHTQRREPSGGRVPSRGGASSRRKKNDTTSIIVLIVEIVVFIALIALFFVLKSKIDDGGSSASADSGAASESTASNGVNVENSDFSLTCTTVRLDMDAENNTVAFVYFTFVNKTDTPLALNAVFPASLKQNGVDCPEDTNLKETPAEIANRDMQVSGGQSVECCYAFKLQDADNPITITVHDNYSTFADIGSTEIPIK
ncbi:MAG: DUF5067 domain-containing protein [Lachnospiraceae bacterium]|nr:DUF5067 domain-containing protein [Lachnospiraceae bacterium]